MLILPVPNHTFINVSRKYFDSPTRLSRRQTPTAVCVRVFGSRLRSSSAYSLVGDRRALLLNALLSEALPFPHP